jgi:hypothetical protein
LEGYNMRLNLTLSSDDGTVIERWAFTTESEYDDDINLWRLPLAKAAPTMLAAEIREAAERHERNTVA